jgi:DNA-binding transcriptional MerR regulator
MFKIGDFSKLSLVSVKALSYYNELGLLRPARVDEFTGYRYYSQASALLVRRKQNTMSRKVENARSLHHLLAEST